MTAPPSAPHPERKWYGLALRNLRIASRLLRAGFPDAAYFHIYHAFECAVSTVIAAKGYQVPPEGRVKIKVGKKTIRYYPSPSGRIKEDSTHKVKLILFVELADRSSAYYARFGTLKSFLTVPSRNYSLYYDPVADQLPHEKFSHSYVLSVYAEVRKFVKEAGTEIL
jgi:hypothetical protein